jgi:DoxX-like family
LGLMRVIAKVSDLFGGRGPITSTSLAMLLAGNSTAPNEFAQAIGFAPRRFAAALESEPAHVQDRWHGRLYFLRPLLRITIALFWLYTGLVTFLFWPKAESYALLRAAHFPEVLIPAAYYLGYLLDAVLGLLLLMRWRVRLVGGTMVALTGLYLVFVSMAEAAQWIHPITPLPIVFVLMVATLVVIAIDGER